MAVVERLFSEFLRQPKSVVAELGEHDVLLRRRNAPALRLSEAGREDERAEAFESLARLLRNVVVHSPDALDGALEEVFAWVTFLPGPDRRLFAEELARTLAGAAAVENYAPISQLLREWKATAEVHADPALAWRLAEPIDAAGDQIPVPGG